MLAFTTGRRLLDDARLMTSRMDDFLAMARGLRGMCIDIAEQFLRSQTSTPSDDVLQRTRKSLGACPDESLKRILESLMPGFGDTGLRTWRSIGTGFTCTFQSPWPCQVPGDPDISLAKQFEWLGMVQRIFLGFPPEMTTPESLAVWAPYFDESLITYANGIPTEGGGFAAHIGRLLASVIDQEGDEGQNVFDTLRLTLEGRHPASTFGGHIPRAFWGSRSAEAHGMLLDHLANTADSDHGRLIVRAAGEASLSHVESVLRCLHSHPRAVSGPVFDEIMGWFGLPRGPRPNDVMGEFLERVVESLDSRSGDIPSPQHPFDRWLDIWMAMSRDVREAVLLVHGVMAGHDAQEMCAALLLASHANHSSTHGALVQALHRPEEPVVATALSLLPPVDRGSPLETRKHQAILLLGQRRRRSAGHRNDWPEVYPEVLSAAIRQRQSPSPCFLPTDSGAPYAQSIDLVLDVVEPGNGRDDLSTDPWHQILTQVTLTPAQWHRFLSVQALSRSGVYWSWRKFILGLDTERVVALCELLCHDPRAPVRKAGFTILAEALDAGHHDACMDLARHVIDDLDGPDPREADDATTALVNVSDTVAELSGVPRPELPDFVRIAFPEVVVTPKWLPQVRAVERWNRACSAAVSSLDERVAGFFAKHAETILAIVHTASRWSPTTADFIPWFYPQLEPWRVQLHSLVSDWWAEEPGRAMNGDPFDLVRLGTVRRTIFDDKACRQRFKDQGIECQALDALHIPQFLLGIGPAPNKHASDAARLGDGPDVLQALQYCTTVLSLLEYLFDRNGTWQHYEWMLDVAETMCAAVPREAISLFDGDVTSLFGQFIPVRSWLQAPASLHGTTPPRPTAKRLFHVRRHTRLKKWYDRSDDPYYLGDFSVAGATLGDVIKALVSKAPNRKYEPARIPHEIVDRIRRDHPDRAQEFDPFFARLASALIASELARTDDAPSAWTPLAGSVGYLEGIDHWLRLVEGTAGCGLARLTNDRVSRRQVLSRLVSVTYPEPGLDQTRGAARIASTLAERRVTEAHLLEAGFLAPQWLPLIGMGLQWPELADAAVWLTRLPWSVFGWSEWSSPEADNDQARESDHESGWLSPQFFEPLSLLDDRPTTLDDGQIRRLVAAARVIMPLKEIDHLKSILAILDGRLDRDAVVSDAMKATRPIDSLPLGLVPLVKDGGRFLDLMERMDAFHLLRRLASSSRRKEDEIEKVDRALEVLARQAGVGTPARLEWMVEAARVCEDFPAIGRGDCESRVVVTPGGAPVMAFTRKGKPVKAPPALIKEHRDFKSQKQFFRTLTKFFERSCQACVEGMVSSLEHSLDDIAWLRRHPIVREILGMLLFTDSDHVGLLTEDGAALTSHDGRRVPLAKGSHLRLVHPIELELAGGLSQWRGFFLERSMTQPIEQVDRPVYRVADVANPGDSAIASMPWGSGLDRHVFQSALGDAWRWEDFGHGNEASRWFERSRIKAVVQSTITADGLMAVSFIHFLNASRTRFDLNRVPAIEFSEAILELHRAARRAATPPRP